MQRAAICLTSPHGPSIPETDGGQDMSSIDGALDPAIAVPTIERAFASLGSADLACG